MFEVGKWYSYELDSPTRVCYFFVTYVNDINFGCNAIVGSRGGISYYQEREFNAGGIHNEFNPKEIEFSNIPSSFISAMPAVEIAKYRLANEI